MPESQQDLGNLLYFEGSSLRELYDLMKSWQEQSGQFFLHLNIQEDGGKFCCIALVFAQGMGQTAIKTEEGWLLKLVNPGYRDAMARFERKALRIIVSENKIGADVEFISPEIAPEKIMEIQSKLKKCNTAMEIRAVFREELDRS